MSLCNIMRLTIHCFEITVDNLFLSRTSKLPIETQPSDLYTGFEQILPEIQQLRLNSMLGYYKSIYINPSWNLMYSMSMCSGLDKQTWTNHSAIFCASVECSNRMTRCFILRSSKISVSEECWHNGIMTEKLDSLPKKWTNKGMQRYMKHKATESIAQLDQTWSSVQLWAPNGWISNMGAAIFVHQAYFKWLLDVQVPGVPPGCGQCRVNWEPKKKKKKKKQRRGSLVSQPIWRWWAGPPGTMGHLKKIARPKCLLDFALKLDNCCNCAEIPGIGRNHPWSSIHFICSARKPTLLWSHET